MSTPSLAYIKHETPFCLFPPKPKKLVSFSRDGGSNDIPNWNRPYPKDTAPINLSIVGLSIWAPFLQVPGLHCGTSAFPVLTVFL